MKNISLKDKDEKKIGRSGDHRLSYHIMPPKGLLNDPNGFIEFGGRYHLFYQWNPFACSHGSKYWGHVSSTDLVQWREHDPALTPVNYYDINGCYSGSAVENKGKLYLFYTGNVKDEEGNRESYQCVAVSDDGMNFNKKGPVIHGPPQGYTKHFRDPKVWKEGDLWHMVIGAQSEKLEGKVLLYSSEDLEKWLFQGEIAGSNLNGLKEFGYMWECPDMFRIEGRDILIASPQGLDTDGDRYNNIYQAGYFLGDMEYDKNTFSHSEFDELDRGFEFYAPQTTEDEAGRRLLVGWMGLPEEEDHPTVEEGWIHAMTIPRELYLKGDKLCQKPVEELKKLRKNQVSYENVYIEGEVTLEGIEGDSYELILEMTDLRAGVSGLKLRCGEDEETLFYADSLAEKLVLNRDRSGMGYGGERRCSLKIGKGIKLHIFVDRSSVEIFVNDGEEVFTARIYPSPESRGVVFFSDRGAWIKKAEKYDL